MRIPVLAAAAAAMLAPMPAAAQARDTLTPDQIAIGCAPPPAVADGDHPLRLLGAQDISRKSVFDEHDLLVVSGGTGSGVQLGQRYFVRRAVTFTAYLQTGDMQRGPHPVDTAGWIRIVAANENTSVAAVDHLCDALEVGDYLEPFAAPVVPSGSGRSGEADFAVMGRVTHGPADRALAGPHDFMLIDRGTDKGVAPGMQVKIFRDVRGGLGNYMVAASQLPLADVGDAVVVSAGPSMAVIQVVRANGSVESGDYVAPRK